MIANEGVLNKAHTIELVRDPNECSNPDDFDTCKIIYKRDHEKDKMPIVSQETANEMMRLLEKVFENEKGTASHINKDFFDSNSFQIGGKTGTSSKERDLWFIGAVINNNSATSEQRIVTGAWLGACFKPPADNDQNFYVYSNETECPITNGKSSDAVTLWDIYMRSILE